MPSTSDEMRFMWSDDDNSEWKALSHLFGCGWKEVGNGFMYSPKDREPEQDEWDAMQYLQEEWDFAYGGKEDVDTK